MADNNLGNDEYEFADLDGLSPDTMGDKDGLSRQSSSSQVPRSTGKKDVIRNALIVVFLIFILMLLYRFMGPFFTKKVDSTQSVTSVSTPIIQPTQQPDVQPEVTPVVTTVVTEEPPPPTQTTPVVQTTIESPELTQKLSAMDLNQQNIRSDVNNISNQLGGINSNINALNSKIANLSQMVTSLSLTVEQQSNQIASLIAVRVQQTKIHAPVRHVATSRPLFYIQAVIPGRAWLIAANGSTLTVREGTILAGYGVVKLIDAVQGRVITSSGRVIRFSQQDS